ncbi:MAG TPA: inositol monophosphatase family protein [Ilumatobacteraceae bacterium]|nr:inositol monophosphatase family protein [Ilumatobacteraceae bacterium]
MSVDRDLPADLALALELAEIADGITLPFFEQRSFDLDWKPDRTEVTQADRRAEAAISAVVANRRPDDGLFGEEHGVVGNLESPWRWVIDPIDGTSNFVRGIPVWASLIALTHAEHGAVVGVVSAPALHRRWWAARGHGALANGRPCHVSSVERLDEAQVCVTFSKGWDEVGLTETLVAIQQGAYRARGFGDFWQHMLVAEGAIDLAIDAIGLEPYDLAAVMVVVEEAGGTFTDRHGERTYLHDSAVSSNGLLHHHIKPLG